MEKRWHSNKLTLEEIKKCNLHYGKIQNPTFGIGDHNPLELRFSLVLDDGDETMFGISDMEDIYSLLKETKVSEIKYLDGKVIEVFEDSRLIRGLSVNKNLI